MRGYVRAGGRFSGGTFASAMTGFSRPRQNMAAARARKAAEPARDPSRRVRHDEPGRPHRARGYWAVPLPTIDPQVIARSARALPRYGPDFSYGHYAAVKRLPMAVGGVAGILGVVAAAQVGPVRRALLAKVPQGDGPTDAQMDAGWFTLTIVGEGGGQRVVCEVAGGDPGYRETSRMLADATLCLAVDGLPRPPARCTTAQAHRPVLRARLKQSRHPLRRPRARLAPPAQREREARSAPRGRRGPRRRSARAAASADSARSGAVQMSGPARSRAGGRDAPARRRASRAAASPARAAGLPAAPARGAGQRLGGGRVGVDEEVGEVVLPEQRAVAGQHAREDQRRDAARAGQRQRCLLGRDGGADGQRAGRIGRRGARVAEDRQRGAVGAAEEHHALVERVPRVEDDGHAQALGQRPPAAPASARAASARPAIKASNNAWRSRARAPSSAAAARAKPSSELAASSSV